MTKLKSKIKVIQPLPNKIKKKASPLKIVFILFLIIALFISIYLTYKTILPYINAVNINKIVDKKTFLTDCNTKDYIIISKDKSYSMQLTDNNCNKKNYEGTIKIKDNEITFIYEENTTKNNIIKKQKKGIIDINNFNIIIDNKTFESDKNE